MEAYLQKYLTETIGMNNADADLFLSGFEVVNFKKGEFIQKVGDKCNVVRIILQGCARGFVLVDGKELTTNFYFEHDHCYDYINYLKQQNGSFFL